MPERRLFVVNARVAMYVNVCFGSWTEVRNRVLDVGFTPKNRHYVAGGACPFHATYGHPDRDDRDDWCRL